VGKKTGVVQVKVPLPVDVNTLPILPALVNPVPPFSTATAVPLHTPLVIVPTLVKLEPVTVAFNVVPVNVPASATILAVLAVVTLPFASTVNVGIDVDDP
jgi:hypothetical protein